MLSEHPSMMSLAILTTMAAFAGCSPKTSNRMLIGTWEGRASDVERPFSFGTVTFAPTGMTTGTYTAEAKYGDTSRVQTGRFVIDDQALILDGERTYTLSFESDSVVFTDPVTDNSMTLDRFD